LTLLHTWQAQLRALVTGVRKTQTELLALLALGVLLAGTVRLPAVAAAVPLTATDESRTRRFRRWLANERVEVPALWAPLRRALLADLAGHELLFVVDPTPQAGHATVVVLGLVRRTRVLPLAWRVVPPQTTWPAPRPTLLGELAAAVAADLPPDVRVTVVADRGITGPETLAAVRAVGWQPVFRLNVGPRQTNRVRVAGVEHDLWTWLAERRFRYAGPVELFKDAGWVAVALTAVWDRTYDEPWVLVGDAPAGPAAVRAYRRRTRIEATFADTKRRGFDLERTKVVALDRLDRLILAVVLALWWGTQLGLRTIRSGRRRRYDRADRRDRSVLKLGLRDLVERLLSDRRVPLPFTTRHGSVHHPAYA
jgi:hypothetical protein